jgi:very-short-patch-repair endonuclease
MYTKLNDTEKKKIISKLYSEENKSFQDIAEIYGTYANKIRRDAKKFNIPIRDKSQAQKNALQTGKHKHPTKGKVRDEETKNKIGASVMGFWDGLTEAELDQRKQVAKNNWDNMTEEQKTYIRQQANTAVRQASKVGSKLERFLLDKLLGNGYRVDFHKEQTLTNTKLQIDLFLPTLNVAIEVDGPSHFLPVWGDDVLDKNIKYDNKKTGLILGKGLVLIRIKQTREFSKARSLVLYNQLLDSLKNITNKYPDKDNRYIEIGE